MPLAHERLFSTGTLIRKLREKQGISMTDFARKTGLGKQHVYKIERDIVKAVNYDIIKEFAEHLNVNPAYLVGWSNVKERLPEMGLTDKDVNTDEIIKKHIEENTDHNKESTPDIDEVSNYTTSDIIGGI